MSRSPEPLAWAEISLANLRHNLREIRRRVGRMVEIMAIVKADAYGHGMRAIATELHRQGVRSFGVANLDEALELRPITGRNASILVLGSFYRGQVESFIRNGVRPTLSSLEDAVLFARAARRLGKKRVPVHVKIDTGMGRLGIWHEEAEQLIAEIAGWPELLIEGIYTHFAGADGPDPAGTHRQIALFNALIKRFERRGIRARFLHAANSMGTARFRLAHLNLVRPGIALYGIHPSGSAGTLHGMRLKPVLSLKARITLIKRAPRGRAISYGSTHTTRRDTLMAVLPVGYSHGYRVGFSNRSEVLIRGRRCPVVGRVTMDQTLVDAGSVRGPRRWEVATLIGGQGKTRITAEELAGHLKTIPYEIVCGLSGRLARLAQP